MTLQEFVGQILNSSPQDWTTIVCWGAGSGPSYRHDLSVWTTGAGDFHNIEIRSHSTVASYKRNLSVSMAWGLESNSDFVEEWANGFPDPGASSYFLDFFYHGVLVEREVYVAVDGGRAYLPLPDREIDNESGFVTHLTIPRGKYHLLKLINSLTSTYDYDDYLHRAGIEVVDQDWPS